MRRHVYVLTAILCFTVTADTLAGEITVDLINRNLNGKKWDELTVESLTDITGRPDVTVEPKQGVYGIKWGALICYTNNGVRFSFEHPQVDGKQKLCEVAILLVPGKLRDYADNEERLFTAFTGSLNKGLNANWKLQKLLDEFKDVGVVDKAAPSVEDKKQEYEKSIKEIDDAMAKDQGNANYLGEKFLRESTERYENLKKSYRERIEDLKDDYYAEIPSSGSDTEKLTAQITRTNWKVMLFYNPTTKFLERIIISRPTIFK